MSATDQVRAMLDGLMGTARDGSDSQKQHLHFSDQRVCRAFLLDCCPHDIFASTKLELGECQNVHDYALRADYIAANQRKDLQYENSALQILQRFVSDADRKTDYLKRKLAETQEVLTAEETSKLNKVHELTEKHGKKLAQIEKATADGDLEARAKFMDEAEKIKKERVIADAQYREVSRPLSSHQQQNLRVCDICSAYLGINDNDSRLADHFGGKLHLGFITVREKLEDLKKLVAEKRGSTGYSSSTRAIERERSSSNHRSRDRERDYPRDYDSRDRIRAGNSDRYRDSRDSRDYYYRYREHSRSGDMRYQQPERSRSGSRDYREPPPRASTTKISEREALYQRRLREWEKRESERSKKYAERLEQEQKRKQLEEQESKKLKEFLEDYKDDRDDLRFYRDSKLARRLSDRRKELEQDEMQRQKEKTDLESLSKSCAINEPNSHQPIERANNVTEPATATTSNHFNGNTIKPAGVVVDLNAPKASSVESLNPATTTTTAATTTTATKPQQPPPSARSRASASDERKRQCGELINSIPTDKEQLFAWPVDWSLLDKNLMEKRIRPWVTKKINEYIGEEDAAVIDFLCDLLNNHSGGDSVLREVAQVLEEEAEKFTVNLWRLLIFELEAKKLGLRKSKSVNDTKE